MNLFTSSSKYRHTPIPIGLTLLTFVMLNLAVEQLPPGRFQRHFDAAIQVSHDIGAEAKIVLFGDSRATRFHQDFFQEKILSYALEGNTVLYSKLLYSRMIAETATRPEVVILSLGANNYNKNGIFTKRDFAVRRLASLPDIRNFLIHPDGYTYAADALFARAFPIYGRRMEIRSIGVMRNMLRKRNEPPNLTDIKGMIPLTYPLEKWQLENEPERSALADRNYLLIYERSVYVKYELSSLHTRALEDLIDLAMDHGAAVIVMQPPVEPIIRDLERKMVETVFDDYLATLKKNKPIIHLDLRDEQRFEFADLNHLSIRGSRELIQEILNPLIRHSIDGALTVAARPSSTP